MDALGAKIRRARLSQNLTLDEVAQRTEMSKAYLSLIETNRVTNPPSDEKLRRLELVLGFKANELVGQANVQRTPRDVRIVLQKLMRQRSSEPVPEATVQTTGISVDNAYLSGLLHEFAAQGEGVAGHAFENVCILQRASAAAVGESVSGAAAVAGIVPIVNRVSAGYPSDFTDLSYPPRNADAYITAPGLDDPDAFAARVFGDSMCPKYGEGDVVIFSPAAAWKEGADCFVRFEDGQTTFKRVYADRDAAGGESLRLVPRNERYPAKVVPRETISGIYRAVSCYRKVDDED